MAGTALLAAISPAVPATRAPVARVVLAPSHGPTASHDWLAAEHVYSEVGRRTPTLDGAARTRLARTLLAEAARAGLDPLVVLAIIHVESSFNPAVVSSAGAVGLMQLLEPTMREVATRAGLPSADPRDPVANVQAGVRYFAGLVRSFSDVELALIAYNAGPNRLRRHLRDGAVPERFWTYPRKVKRELDRLHASLASSPARSHTLLASAARPSRRLLSSHVSATPISTTASAAAMSREAPFDGSALVARAERTVRGVEHVRGLCLPASSVRPLLRGARISASARRSRSVRARRGRPTALASR